MDCIQRWSGKTEIRPLALVEWLDLGRSKYYAWKNRYGKAHEHNAWIPRDHGLEAWEREAMLSFYRQYPEEGYRRLALMMLDRDVVAVSPTSVYRVLLAHGLIGQRPLKPSMKGKGFVQPLKAHEHGHVDMSYLNICGTFYYLCSILDGYSRMMVHWEIREQMKEADVETIVQRALEKYPRVHPRIISDNGPQFIAKDFKEFIRITGLSHVRTSPYYPQSNGKIERWHRTLKADCIRPGTPLSLEDARRIVEHFVTHYNTIRLHSAIGYVTPWDKLCGKEQALFAERDRKLEQAREQRKINRQKQLDNSLSQQAVFSI
jgi:putative transposase